MDNPEKPATRRRKAKQKQKTICVVVHYAIFRIYSTFGIDHT
jgi:hypothetical protein